uniref:Uncharacterized protein n=1 Tax=Timema tahoe TaxID=61484 RepID=A0A7R9FH75_9NEOP|nr:unnamed protein product [Timema tahoe]
MDCTQLFVLCMHLRARDNVTDSEVGDEGRYAPFWPWEVIASSGEYQVLTFNRVHLAQRTGSPRYVDDSPAPPSPVTDRPLFRLLTQVSYWSCEISHPSLPRGKKNLSGLSSTRCLSCRISRQPEPVVDEDVPNKTGPKRIVFQSLCSECAPPATKKKKILGVSSQASYTDRGSIIVSNDGANICGWRLSCGCFRQRIEEAAASYLWEVAVPVKSATMAGKSQMNEHKKHFVDLAGLITPIGREDEEQYHPYLSPTRTHSGREEDETQEETRTRFRLKFYTSHPGGDVITDKERSGLILVFCACAYRPGIDPGNTRLVARRTDHYITGPVINEVTRPVNNSDSPAEPTECPKMIGNIHLIHLAFCEDFLLQQTEEIHRGFSVTFEAEITLRGGIGKVIFRGSVPHIYMEGEWKHVLEKNLSTPDQDSNHNLPVFGSPEYCENITLDHAATEFPLLGSCIACFTLPPPPPHPPPQLSSDRLKPRSGHWAVTIDFLQEAAITSLSSGPTFEKKTGVMRHFGMRGGGKGEENGTGNCLVPSGLVQEAEEEVALTRPNDLGNWNVTLFEY